MVVVEEMGTQEEKGKKVGGESILSFVPWATACHHICIKPVSCSGSTCWLSERLLREREEGDTERETKSRRRGKTRGRGSGGGEMERKKKRRWMTVPVVGS